MEVNHLKWKSLFAVLLGLLMIGVNTGSAAAISSSAHNPHAKVVVMKEFPTKLLVNTPTRQIFIFGDLLIDYKTNGNEATILIRNTSTGKIMDVVYMTSTKIGNSYTLTVRDSSGVSYSIRTPINIIAPGLRTKQLASKPLIDKKLRVMYNTQRHYWWDGVYFVKGYMIRYHHPDYEEYGIEPWRTVSIKGNKLTHLHFSSAASEFLIQLGPTALGAAIGAYYGSIAGAVAGAIVGLIGGITLGHHLLDEHGCLWVWFSREVDYVLAPTHILYTTRSKILQNSQLHTQKQLSSTGSLR